jgi:hypothetical protein
LIVVRSSKNRSVQFGHLTTQPSSSYFTLKLVWK